MVQLTGISYLRQQAKDNIKKYIDERLPEEYEKCLVGLTAILREAWNTSEQAEDRREKIHTDGHGNEDNKKEPNEPDYDDQKCVKVGEEKQEQETGQITINQVF